MTPLPLAREGEVELGVHHLHHRLIEVLDFPSLPRALERLPRVLLTVQAKVLPNRAIFGFELFLKIFLAGPALPDGSVPFQRGGSGVVA